MRVAILTVQVPFVYGGAEQHAEGLRQAIERAGHQACIVALPFKWYPPDRVLDHLLACRLFDLSESAGVPIDRVIGLKFPAYLVPHPNKVLWILHQHRAAYDLWESSLGDLIRYPDGALVRDAVLAADQAYLPEARRIYGNSKNVTTRLLRYCGIEATPLYHPPPAAEAFFSSPAQDYFFFPSRLWPTKRQWLVIEALSRTREVARVRFAGAADHPDYALTLRARAVELGVAGRIEWLGAIAENEKVRQYAHALAVVYPPADEDYGYVTLEAMLAGKAVLTCSDSGGPLEFVVRGETGLVVEPTPEALAAAMDRLWCDRPRARAMGEMGREHYRSLGISWQGVVEELLG